MDNRTDYQSELNDLLFELSDTGQGKFCVGICDDPGWRESLTKSIETELRARKIHTLVLKPKRAITDLVELIRKRTESLTSHVVVIDGLDEMEVDSLDITLSYLNFKRDILFSLNTPILFWFTNAILTKVVARAPDFWSRRTVTKHFTTASVSKLIQSIFQREKEGDSTIRDDGKVFRNLQRIFSHERILEQLSQPSKKIPVLELDRLASEIEVGVNELISECHDSNRIEVTYRLWVLSDTDEWLKHITRNLSSRFDSPLKDFYSERMDILLRLADKMPQILEKYKSNLLGKAKRKHKINLLGYFGMHINAEIDRRYKNVLDDEDLYLRMNSSEIEHIVANDKSLQRTISDDLAERAASELSDWIQRKTDRLPSIFDHDEGQLLRLLYDEKKNPSEMAKQLGLKNKDATEKIFKLRTKVLLFLGVDSLQ